MRVSREFIERAIEENGYLAVWVNGQLLMIRATDALVNTVFGIMYPDREEMVEFVISENWETVERTYGRWVVRK